jgi:hypothetical protein
MAALKVPLPPHKALFLIGTASRHHQRSDAPTPHNPLTHNPHNPQPLLFQLFYFILF